MSSSSRGNKVPSNASGSNSSSNHGDASSTAAAVSSPPPPQHAPLAAVTTTSPRTTNSTLRDVDYNRCKHVLTVGDGNFSYSLAFAKQFVAPTASGSERSGVTAVRLVATSYDSYDELVDKYPESARICAQLRDCGALVLHRVDATNLRASLDAAALGTITTSPASSNDEQGAVSRPTIDRFDMITFNHPHCGEENVRRHQSLLSHFYFSALEILCADSGSEIHLTLAAGQPERWQALDRAHRAGLRLKQRVDDVDSHETFGLEYERKRHQNGKSFHRVLLHGEKLQQQSTLFVFERAVAGTAVSVRDELLVSSSVSSAAVGTKSVGTTGTQDDSEPPSRKRKAQDTPEAARTEQQQPAAAFACNACERSFKTAQGLKTHVHMVHELGQTARAVPVLLPCGICDRTFKNADAQRQHRLAKHGDDQLIRPDWYQKQQQQQLQDTEPQSEDAKRAVDTASAPTHPAPEADGVRVPPQQLTCAICDFTFRSQSSLDAHWQDLRPKEVVLRACERCGRAFDEERALRQHQNFCKAQPVASVTPDATTMSRDAVM